MIYNYNINKNFNIEYNPSINYFYHNKLKGQYTIVNPVIDRKKPNEVGKYINIIPQISFESAMKEYNNEKIEFYFTLYENDIIIDEIHTVDITYFIGDENILLPVNPLGEIDKIKVEIKTWANEKIREEYIFMVDESKIN